MKLQFDATQQYQLDAVRAVVDLFEGQPLSKGTYEVSFQNTEAGAMFTEQGVGNHLLLTDEQLLQNVRAVQQRNGISQLSERLEPAHYTLEGRSGAIPLNFTVEMETGTGKTYTYLRTIYELNKVYGFRKFVIVVPSVAIREGTVKNLEITGEHFSALYGNPPVNFLVYDSSRLTSLRNFATANAIQILVINIDSFTKDTNVINQIRERGIKPIESIQVTRPIVIVDEPQNMETDIRKAAIHRLNPLCTLRYSATHRNLYNLVYSLNPVQAYDMGLVKRIEVDGISAEENYNAAYVELRGVKPAKKTIRAKLRIYCNDKDSVKPKDVWAEPGDDLYRLSNGREMYKHGFILNSINAQAGSVEFSGGLVLRDGQTQGGLTDEILKFQIDRAVKWHFEKEKKLRARGIKVLSLFFIDKVSSYREYDADGNGRPGRFALWFEEIYNRYASMPDYRDLLPFAAQDVHNGYFSQDKGKFRDTNGTTKADNDTYSLIMKDKERLLSAEEPLRFIFSHSALREGWDNPNVFQICTLKETQSDIKKRQEIGRGLRLPVDSTGQRMFDRTLNILTVVANETYEDFSAQLQKELQEEAGVEFKDRIHNARSKGQIKLSKELTRENCPEFFELWDRIKHCTRYRVEFSTEELIGKAVDAVGAMQPTTRPMLKAEKVILGFSDEGVQGQLVDIGRRDTETVRYSIPDVYSYVQGRVDITRHTILEILKQSGRMSELEVNPQMFLDNVVACIRQALNTLMIDGIKYEQIDGREYEMRLFENEEIETYLSNLLEVNNPDKTLYNFVPVDSQTERAFARECEADSNIRFFFKLPRGFKIPTPIGAYVPDWAIVFENDRRIYFVAETKSTLNIEQLRGVEAMKIECGKKHFELFEQKDVAFRQVREVRDLYG